MNDPTKQIMRSTAIGSGVMGSLSLVFLLYPSGSSPPSLLLDPAISLSEPEPIPDPPINMETALAVAAMDSQAMALDVLNNLEELYAQTPIPESCDEFLPDMWIAWSDALAVEAVRQGWRAGYAQGSGSMTGGGAGMQGLQSLTPINDGHQPEPINLYEFSEGIRKSFVALLQPYMMDMTLEQYEAVEQNLDFMLEGLTQGLAHDFIMIGWEEGYAAAQNGPVSRREARFKYREWRDLHEPFTWKEPGNQIK